MNANQKKDYSDMLELAHHVSKVHPQMSIEKRAAQFSPFAALTGYASEIEEKKRLTEKKAELDEDRKAELEWDLQTLQQRLEEGEHPYVSVTHFVPDDKKDGGAYVTIGGTMKKIDDTRKQIVFLDGQTMELDLVYAIQIDG